MKSKGYIMNYKLLVCCYIRIYCTVDISADQILYFIGVGSVTVNFFL
jgi:hypothetical protein